MSEKRIGPDSPHVTFYDEQVVWTVDVGLTTGVTVMASMQGVSLKQGENTILTSDDEGLATLAQVLMDAAKAPAPAPAVTQAVEVKWPEAKVGGSPAADGWNDCLRACKRAYDAALAQAPAPAGETEDGGTLAERVRRAADALLEAGEWGEIPRVVGGEFGVIGEAFRMLDRYAAHLEARPSPDREAA